MRSFTAVKKSAGDPCGRPRAGKSPKRRQWRKKRGDFEEVPRLAATTVAGNRLARRWAREPRPYAPHGSILHRADRVVRPYERVINSAGAGDRKGCPYAFSLRHPPIFPLSIFIFPLEKLLPLFLLIKPSNGAIIN